MKALEILNKLIKSENWEDYYPSKNDCNNAIKEIEALQQSNKDLLNTIIEAQEVIKNVLEGKMRCTNSEALEVKDRLEELEKVIFDYFLDKGYEKGDGGFDFNVEIDSYFKSKRLIVYFRENNNDCYDNVFDTEEEETAKEMFDKSFEYFTIKAN